MNHSVQTIPFLNLAIAFVPVAATMAILIKWSLNSGNALYAVLRMLIQLLLVGYFLTYIFESDSATIIVIVLAVMVFASSWIALGTVTGKGKRLALYKYAFWSIVLGGGITLALVTQGTLELSPWYWPQYMIPLAGMIFANSMNSVSLAAERLEAELTRDIPYQKARNVAFHTSLIPVINSLFAVGLVSLPGMMTGQILSGVSPLIAARYQIMVMLMIFGSAGISAACFLVWARPVFEARSTQNK